MVCGECVWDKWHICDCCISFEIEFWWFDIKYARVLMVGNPFDATIYEFKNKGCLIIGMCDMQVLQNMLELISSKCWDQFLMAFNRKSIYLIESLDV